MTKPRWTWRVRDKLTGTLSEYSLVEDANGDLMIVWMEHVVPEPNKVGGPGLREGGSGPPPHKGRP